MTAIRKVRQQRLGLCGLGGPREMLVRQWDDGCGLGLTLWEGCEDGRA